ncbi:transposase, IS116/IS110/IS902 family [Mycolicibacterium canariasense]|uniref:Transposase, IS116/IS110/IS902 family n=1 Tax=Mycolicibacterium canariasense TaxID=228230 RepID=A0A100WF20_MYCCR|nr:transposase, IS116/IS110/IS902 family [Mycolicibacterium canariasense]
MEADSRPKASAHVESVRDLMRVRHGSSKLLLRQGRVYSAGQAWNGVHETCLRRERFDDSHTTATKACSATAYCGMPSPSWPHPSQLPSSKLCSTPPLKRFTDCRRTTWLRFPADDWFAATGHRGGTGELGKEHIKGGSGAFVIAGGE